MDYSVTVTPPAGYNRTDLVRHMLMQKKDGTMYLVLWHEISGADISVTPVKELTHPNIPVRVNFGQDVTYSAVFTWDNNGNMSRNDVTISNRNFSMNIQDRITVLRFRKM